MKAAERSDWRTSELPSKRTTIALDRLFPPHDIERIKLGLIPQEMEDKWFVYWEKDALFFHRSWTGFCIFIVRFVIQGDACRMVEADLNRDPDQYGETSDSRDARMISFLIDTLLLGTPAAFPSGVSGARKKAIEMWAAVGRAMLGQHPDRK